MSGYKGQDEGFDTTPVDGEAMFTEKLRRSAYAVLRTGTPDLVAVRELRSLAFQDPYPSHQARYLLDRLIERGLALDPFYDNTLAQAGLGDQFPSLGMTLQDAEAYRQHFNAGPTE